MNTNDLPPAAKLAALIEAGRAANPDLKHGKGRLFSNGRACALGFAGLGAGMARDDLQVVPGPYARIAEVVGTDLNSRLFDGVWIKNDCGASLEEICKSLREGALATA